jgi:hypothetical protein
VLRDKLRLEQGGAITTSGSEAERISIKVLLQIAWRFHLFWYIRTFASVLSQFTNRRLVRLPSWGEVNQHMLLNMPIFIYSHIFLYQALTDTSRAPNSTRGISRSWGPSLNEHEMRARHQRWETQCLTKILRRWMIHTRNFQWKVNSTLMSQIDLGYWFKLEIVDSRSTRGDLLGEASFLSSRTILDANVHLSEPPRTLDV